MKKSQFSARIVFGPGFGTLLGFFWEGIWPPGNSKSVSSVPSGRPRADPRLLFSAPRASKSAPRGVQERFIRLWKASFGLPSLFQGLKRPPGRLQEASRAHLAAMLAVFWSNFATHSKRCCHHVGHSSSLKAPSLGPQKSKKHLGKILLDSDAARRLSRSELGSAAPRPLVGPAPCGVRNKNISLAHGVEPPAGFCGANPYP